MKENDERRTKNEEVGSSKPIKYFTDLKVWQEGRVFVVLIYKAAETFPHHERYALSNQITRAVVSITSNIAEGFKRETMKDKLRFYVMSHGSLTEVQNQLFVALDVGYITTSDFSRLYLHSEVVDRLLTGLIKATKERLKP